VLISPLWAATKAKKPPQYITIQGSLWDFQIIDTPVDPEDKDVMGLTNCRDRRIKIHTDTPRSLIRIVFHELFHALACTGSITGDTRYNNTDNDHAGIYFAARAWERFLCDNPDMFRWLLYLEEQADVEQRLRDDAMPMWTPPGRAPH
jgi:hypothetical protein